MELRVLSSAEPGLWSAILALALTYLAHSAVWAAAVALLTRPKALSSAKRHAHWKAALFGPLLSTCLALGAQLHVCSRQLFDGSSLTEGSAAFRKSSGAERASARSDALDVVARSSPSGRTWALLILLGMGAGLLRFGASAYVLRRSLRGRVLVTDERILGRFARLRACTKVGAVKLTMSSTVQSPLVLGAGELCVPEVLFSELRATEMDAVLAHELAHLERRDGVWFPVVAAVQATLWLQPLNHLVCSCLRDSAELACDDRAVELTGSPLGLARALVHVATTASSARPSLFVATMLRHRSALIPRVRRLTEASNAVKAEMRPQGRSQAALKWLVIGAALATLSVRVAGARSKLSNVLAADVTRGALATVAPRPDAAEQSAKMADLAAREQALVRELFTEKSRARADVTGSPEAVRALELAQELRHVRAMQAWLEERFVAEWAAFEGRSLARR